jgi:hypothetical protein
MYMIIVIRRFSALLKEWVESGDEGYPGGWEDD